MIQSIAVAPMANFKAAFVVYFLFSLASFILGLVVFAGLRNAWSKQPANYLTVTLPGSNTDCNQRPHTGGQFCAAGYDTNGDIVELQNFVDGSMYYCVDHYLGNRIVAATGLYSRSISHYALQCNDGSDTCVTALSSDCNKSTRHFVSHTTTGATQHQTRLVAILYTSSMHKIRACGA